MPAIVGGRPAAVIDAGLTTGDVEYGILRSGEVAVVGRFGTQLLAAINARSTGGEYVLMRTTVNGWRTLDGHHTPLEVSHRRWSRQSLGRSA